MERRVCRSLSLAAACAVLLALPAQAQTTENQFTGSWIHYLAVAGTPGLPTLVTIHSDGTMNASSSVMFGSPAMPAAPIRYSPVHGVWQKVGPKSIQATNLFFWFAHDGRMLGYQRNRIVFKLGADRDTYAGLLFLEQLECGPMGVFQCPDPLDPSLTWTANPNMPPGGYQVTGYRIKVVPYPDVP